MGVTATVRGLRLPILALAAEPEKFNIPKFPMRFKRVDSGPGIRFDFLAGEDGKEISRKSTLEKPEIQPGKPDFRSLRTRPLKSNLNLPICSTGRFPSQITSHAALAHSGA